MKKILYLLIISVLVGCGKSTQTAKPVHKEIRKASFSADSAYQYVEDQVQFGPRVPGSESHGLCVNYLAEQLRRFGAAVELQRGEKTDYAGNRVDVVNISGSINPSVGQRVLLAAHYDSRPWADQESDDSRRHSPILGANDGASGVGVLLEIARQLRNLNTDLGIDIVFFDAEDMGAPEFYRGKESEDDWCLGSQLWAKECKSANRSSRYRFGIVLDMVGAGDATFPQEYFSTRYASEYVQQIWRTAHQIGYGRYFSSAASFPITDDHYYVNTIAGVPCVDIIHYTGSQNYGDSGFPDSWHTHADNMSVINKNTLDAVGTTVMTYLTSVK